VADTTLIQVKQLVKSEITEIFAPKLPSEPAIIAEGVIRASQE
jgi:hypothetical protein